MLFGFLLKHYVRMTRVCSNCDKTTSKSQSKKRKKCNFHNQLTISPLLTATGAIASLLDVVIILLQSTGIHESFPLFLTLGQLWNP